VILILSLGVSAKTFQIKVGEKFPVSEITKQTTQADNTIVAFVPSLSSECEYAGMLTNSFYYYFVKNLAFEGIKNSPKTQIVLVVNDVKNLSKETTARIITTDMEVVYDEKGVYFNKFGVSLPKDKDADSTILLLDSKGFIKLVDDKYRSQGEHLKPLENKLKNLNGIKQFSKTKNSKPLKIGDKAPNFKIDEKTMLSDLKGEVVSISFYPAAFSGVLQPNPFDFIRIDKSDLQLPSIMSCAAEIVSIDKITLKETPKEPKRILISSSTQSLLKNWESALGTSKIVYVNDANYSVSKAYSSYNENGYNNRVSVVVDKTGKIAFVEMNYNAETDKKIEEVLNKLLENK
jgi:peroxiredoxin